ncbi:MAG: NAD(P)-binding protein [Cyanobacteria bacterium P01_F01_bin.53]
MSHSICILGGGFGGLYTALALSKLDWGDDQPDITLVDKREQITARITAKNLQDPLSNSVIMQLVA